MRLSALSLVLSLSVFGAVNSAKADTLVPNSTYDVYLDNNGATQDYTVTVGTQRAFTFGAASGTISETQTILATDQSQLVFTINANSDLFPGSGGVKAFGVGAIDPLNFTAPFDLASAIVTFSVPGSSSSGDATGTVANPNPFNGAFPGPGLLLSFDFGGIDELQLTLTSVAPATSTPEPSSLALLATGITALGGFARRLSQQAH